MNDGSTHVKGGFVIKRIDYSKPVFFEAFGEDRIVLYESIPLDSLVQVSFYADSRETKKGGYITSLRCTNIVMMNPQSMTPTAQPLPHATLVNLPVDSDSAPAAQPLPHATLVNLPLDSDSAPAEPSRIETPDDAFPAADDDLPF